MESDVHATFVCCTAFSFAVCCVFVLLCACGCSLFTAFIIMLELVGNNNDDIRDNSTLPGTITEMKIMMTVTKNVVLIMAMIKVQ